MGILSRISKVLESNVNSLLDRAEDPAKLLDQAIEDMKKGKEEARRALIDAKTELRLCEKRRDKARAEASDYERRAMQALEIGDENLARRYVEQKLSAEERGDAEASAAAEHDAQIRQLEVAEKELDRRLAAMPAKRAALLARKATAEARGARTGAASKAASSVAGAMETFDRMENKIIRAEVEAEVRTAGDPLLLDAGSLDAHRADEALGALKAKMAAQLAAGTPKPAPEPAAAPAEPNPVDDSLAALKAKLASR